MATPTPNPTVARPGLSGFPLWILYVPQPQRRTVVTMPHAPRLRPRPLRLHHAPRCIHHAILTTPRTRSTVPEVEGADSEVLILYGLGHAWISEVEEQPALQLELATEADGDGGGPRGRVTVAAGAADPEGEGRFFFAYFYWRTRFEHREANEEGENAEADGGNAGGTDEGAEPDGGDGGGPVYHDHHAAHPFVRLTNALVWYLIGRGN